MKFNSNFILYKSIKSQYDVKNKKEEALLMMNSRVFAAEYFYYYFYFSQTK